MAVAVERSVEFKDVGDGVHVSDGSDEPSRPSVQIDFDLLVSNIEKSIMEDHDRGATVGITPRELLSKTNPGLFPDGRDFTNPRELYSWMSVKAKSIEDLRQDVANSIKNDTFFPKLTKSHSLREINRRSNTVTTDNPVQVQSTVELYTPKSGNPVPILVVTKTPNATTGSVENLRRVPVSEEKENIRCLNLPTINTTTHSAMPEEREKTQEKVITLPNIQDEQVNGQQLQEEGYKSPSTKKVAARPREEVANGFEGKMDKWFSEMPNEVFDKAQRALMEESIRDRLHMFQEKRSKKSKFAHGKKRGFDWYARRVPNTYLELRVDSFGQHLKENSAGSMNKYKLQQKSLHKLKMVDREDVDKPVVDKPHPPAMPHRTYTNLTKQTMVSEKAKTKRRKYVENQDKGLKTVNMNDVALDGAFKPNPRIPLTKFEEYNDRFDLYNSANDLYYNNSMHHSRLPDQTGHLDSTRAHEIMHSMIEREKTKATIVNLMIEKAVQPKRSPEHVKKSVGNGSKCQTSEESTNKENAGTNGRCGTPVEDFDDPAVYRVDQNGNIIQTKLPSTHAHPDTSTSSESQYCGSSDYRHKTRSKSVLKKFKTLEVFSEKDKVFNAPKDDKTFKFPNYSLNGRQDPSYKLDLKKYPHSTSPQKENGEVSNSEVRLQELVFRFNPGEVVVSRKNDRSARSSERARIIYGKSLIRDDRFAFLARDDGNVLRDNGSMRSFKTNATRYLDMNLLGGTLLAESMNSPTAAPTKQEKENRSQNPPLDSDTQWPANITEEQYDGRTITTMTKTPVDFMGPKHVQTRDMAVETEWRHNLDGDLNSDYEQNEGMEVEEDGDWTNSGQNNLKEKGGSDVKNDDENNDGLIENDNGRDSLELDARSGSISIKLAGD